MRFGGWMAGYAVVACLFLLDLTASTAHAQLHDSLDAYPPRWQLDTSDCDARVVDHRNLADQGIDGGGCETVTVVAGNGSEALLAYRIEPVMVVDDLTATVAVMSAKQGLRVGLRVRFPYERDDLTNRPLSTVVFGASYTHPGEFTTLGVGRIGGDLNLKIIALRQQFNRPLDLRDPYVDAIIVNAYGGAGATTVRLDEIKVQGMLSIGDAASMGYGNFSGIELDRNQQFRIGSADGELGQSILTQPTNRTVSQTAFPTDTVIRILQHNGEPLSWVRSLGFDAVLLSAPPDAEILREAIQAQLLVYAPPPTAPDPSLEPLLDPVAGWFIGSGLSLDSSRVGQATVSSNRLRNFPGRWQRPVIAAPAEAWRDYAAIADALVDDQPIRERDLSAVEEVAETSEKRVQVGDRVQFAVGIASMPSHRAMEQNDAISLAIGAPPSGMFRWHSMLLQTVRSIENAPAAILFRSSRSLASGTEMAAHRSMALGYTNRLVAMLGPWIAGSQQAAPLPLSGARYRCGHLTTADGADLLLLTSEMTRGSEVLAGDGQSIEIVLPPDLANRTVWRMTHFSAERIEVIPTADGARIPIVSPDVAEIIIISDDPALGSKLSASAKRFVRQASLDRWQLTTDCVRITRELWNQAVAMRAAEAAIPIDLLTAAANTIAEGESTYRAGDAEATLRIARRADAWGIRCSWQLSQALMSDWPHPTSCPPIDSGLAAVQIAWSPLMEDVGWGLDRLTSGGLDSPTVLAPGSWTFGQRRVARATSEVYWTDRGHFDGVGALRLIASSQSDTELPGGYAGTVAQLQSPPVRIPTGKAYRIDAMVRTMGFGNPHQGLLVYDSLGGQEMGVLVRGRTEWTPVRLYRQATEETQVRVMFELLGGGEAVIDEVRVQLWEPKAAPPLPFVPLRAAEENDLPNSRF
ncbi:hypothetical protein Pla52n_66980 [Stieleria varia]|uniref:Uncharacterized protein n=1 Tax=Stieleria varia TaxID=2528005 RepID=A0A5C5ZVF5_9BACT|nr:hypothetical protein Pla52n_66980 [Stieleria varia]